MKHVLECTGYEMLVNDIDRADGYYLFDSKGRRYMDFESGVWCMALGHNNSQVNEVIKKQIDRIMHLGFRYTNELVETAAVDVLSTLEIFNGKCVFLSSGSEAVEFGVKTAKTLLKSKKMLTFKESYLSAYGTSGSKDDNQWVKLELSRCLACCNNYNCKECRLVNEIPFNEIGTFVFEPGNTAGLVLIPPKNLVEEISRRIKQNNGLIVVDEVTTGVGRTGKWYGFQHFNMEPDIIALGKGIGNGHPVSVAAVNEVVAQKIERENIHHSQSHQNDVLGCAVVSEVIRYIRQEDLIKRSSERGQYFIDKLKQLKQESNSIKEVRGSGMMIALEFYEGAKNALESTADQLFKNGFIVGYKPAFNLMRFYPSLITTKEDIDSLVECMRLSI